MMTRIGDHKPGGVNVGLFTLAYVATFAVIAVYGSALIALAVDRFASGSVGSALPHIEFGVCRNDAASLADCQTFGTAMRHNALFTIVGGDG